MPYTFQENIYLACNNLENNLRVEVMHFKWHLNISLLK